MRGEDCVWLLEDRQGSQKARGELKMLTIIIPLWWLSPKISPSVRRVKLSCSTVHYIWLEEVRDCRCKKLNCFAEFPGTFSFVELKVNVQVDEEEYRQHGGTTGVREKKQMVTGPHKGRCQRLERKASYLSCITNQTNLLLVRVKNEDYSI